MSKTKSPFSTGIETAGNATSAATTDAKSISKRAIKNFTAEYGNASVVQWFTLSNGLVADLSTTPPATLEALGKVAYFGPKRLTRYGPALMTLLDALR